MWLCDTHIDLAEYDVDHATYDNEEVKHVPRVSEVALQRHDTTEIQHKKENVFEHLMKYQCFTLS